MERTAGIEPASSAWKAEVIAIIRSTLCREDLANMPHLTEKKTLFLTKNI
ncbi:hypothetical protein VAE130_600898 [Vibrio aestuarianus]|nr:hypothetical protein VAE308_1280028 [Vibrio aestuarianus]CAH8229452.1 hypothetical protein VIBAE_B10982 [Vibrio aestuarianus subsp. francensis]CAH8231270.1 hypothetical protein VAE032_330371 [Vibrio aestuarianus]CAH8231278.1 hypothetical protein VAE128_500888 [Vibrio aestuarianus]CAH8231372.1 hypothetical protein VAE055_420899 [Vibrio aestuarianus]